MPSELIRTLDDVEALVKNGVPESRTLEYKSELPGNGSDSKREFLADVSAMANAIGGTIIFGVEEKDGVPIAATGLACPSVDDEIQRVENLLRNGVAPRIIGHDITPLQSADGKCLIAMTIPRSLSAPHMVTLDGAQRFYVRNSNGKHPMDVGELRMAFLQSSSMIDQARKWRDERLDAIGRNRSVVNVGNSPKLIFHLIPLGSLSAPTSVDVRELYRNADDLRPMSGVHDVRFNLDGFLSEGFPKQDGSLSGYTQAFRTGQIEACESIFFTTREGKNYVASYDLERRVIASCKDYLKALNTVGLAAPTAVSLAILGAQDYTMGMQAGMYPDARMFDRPVIVPPEVLLQSHTSQMDVELRPLFDALWNASGFSGSPNYDASGHHIKR